MSYVFKYLLDNFLPRKFISARTSQKPKIKPAAWSAQGEVGFWLVTQTGQNRRIPVSEKEGQPCTFQTLKALKAE